MKKLKTKIVLVLVCLAFLLSLSACGKKMVELKFDTNGGNVIASVSLDENATYTLPTQEEMSKEGYEFEGWYLNADFSGEAVTSVTVTAETTIYAKWVELVKINLDLDGGSGVDTVIYGKVGDNVLSLVENLKPTKSGLVFGAWSLNGTELTQSTKLTAKGLTLKALYKAEYTVQIYKQNLTQDGYELEEKTLTAYVGKTVSATVDEEGFKLNEEKENVESITISNDKTKNVLTVYLDREVYTITFRSNYPGEDVTQDSKTYDVLYGSELTIPAIDYSIEGYYLLGWATSADGELAYDAHFIDNKSINGESTEITYDTIKPSRSMSLYAKWNKGYKDMFGGSDYLFLTSDKKTVYMCRGGIYFVGEYFEDDNSFIFYNDYENIEGKCFSDETFAYYTASRDEYSATLYVVGTGLDENVKILFDAYNGITYSEKIDESTTEESVGTYTIDENGYYVATFTEGPLKDKTLTIVIGTVTLNSVKTDAFQLRNEEEYEMGNLVRFVVYQNKITYYTTAYDITLTGFGTCVYNTGSSKSSYYYTYDKENQTLTLTNSSGSSVGVLKLMEENGKKGYMPYTEDYDKTFTSEAGDTLVLDGIATATYTSGENVVSGYYSISSSAFGGLIVTFTSNDKTYTFLTKTTSQTQTVDGEQEGETTEETITIYSFVTKPEGYQEYYYKDAAGTYYAPLIVLNDKEEGKASIYGYTQTKTFELVQEGTYTLDESGKYYLYTQTNLYEVEVLTSPLDLSTVSQVKFAVDTTNTKYAINYWYSATISEEKADYDVKYTNADGSTLVLVNGMAILSKDGYVLTGSYSTKEGVTTITSTSSGSSYVEIDEESKTFIVYDYAPYSAYVVMEDGTYSKKEYITFDGKGGAKYYYYVTETTGEGEDQKEEEVLKYYEGTITKTEELTKRGNEVYEFKSEGKTFKYLTVTASSYTYIFVNYGNYAGSYTSEDGILYLDGFNYYASYTDQDGNESLGIYSLASENVIRVLIDSKYHYFDMKDQTFTARGTEYGTYILMDNQGMPGKYIEFDGYGKFTIFTYEKDAEEEYQKQIIDSDGKYTIEGDLLTLVYKDGIEETTLVGSLGTYTYSSTTYNTFVIDHKEVVKTFYNTKDWSILKLDSIGNATLISNKGVKETGSYKLITSTLLYYVNSDSSDANIFTYDLTKGTIVESEFTARGYYTQDLNSLLFSQYGFAIFNNETRYYYTMRGNDVIIYHQDATSKEANEYGFVEENFGEFLDVKEYGGKTYYSNDGYAISFKRATATATDYPVLVKSDPETYGNLEDLVFTPSGSDTFSVSGTVKVDGTNYTCTVVRTLEEEVYKMYVIVGYYQFEIKATYMGRNEGESINASYEVVGLQYVRYFYPYTYLSNYYMIYSFLGSTYASNYTNNLGMFYIYKTYGVDGKESDNYMKVTFLDGSACYNLNGELLSTDKATYEYNETSGVYTATYDGGDGYTYKLYFILSYHSAFQLYGYRIYALTRVETYTSGEFEVTLEKLIATDAGYTLGNIFTGKIKKGENEIEPDLTYTYNDCLYFIDYTKDENEKITGTKYYKITYVTEESSIEEQEEDAKTIIKTYTSVNCTELTATTIYSEDGKDYIDVIDGKIMIFTFEDGKYIATECSYDEASRTYTVTTGSTKFSVVMGENTFTITQIEENDNTEEGNTEGNAEEENKESGN